MHEKCSNCYFKDFDVSIAQLINRGLVVSVCVFNLLKTEGTNTYHLGQLYGCKVATDCDKDNRFLV